MSTTPIGTLQRDLLDELRRDARGPRVAKILGAYAASEDDWRAYALFDAAIYTRNLVVRHAEFEMLVLCWNRGQASPIHNHAGQQCWMTVLEGEIEERLFAFAGGGSGPLVPGRLMRLPQGRVAYIDDEIALHRVQPAAGGTGISLHVYARPIDVCNVYDETTGRVEPRRLAYHSVEPGRPVSTSGREDRGRSERQENAPAPTTGTGA